MTLALSTRALDSIMDGVNSPDPLHGEPENPARADVLGPVAARAATGDRAAQEQLTRGLFPRMLGVARRILGPAHPEIDDAIQESLVAFLAALPRFRGESSVVRYATLITVRTSLRMSRRGRERQRRQDAIAIAQVRTPATSLESAALAERRREAMRQVMDSLATEQAEALALRVVLGYSLKETAEAAGAPVNTIRSRLRLAKQSLQTRIDGDAHLRELLRGEG